MSDIERIDIDNGRTLKIERGARASGQTVAMTVLARTGRILGVAEIQVPLSPGFTLAGRVGEDEARKIEQAVRDLATRVANAVQAEPK